MRRKNDIPRYLYGRIIYDTRTGVEYWMSYGYSNVLTPLIDVDGKPLIYDRSEEE